MSFAMLEIKVVLAYLLTNFDFEVENELLTREGVGFGLGSTTKFIVKPIKK